MATYMSKKKFKYLDKLTNKNLSKILNPNNALKREQKALLKYLRGKY